ncbi:TPA: hypothetical protein DEP21_04905, partial [Patescibacteria group bacterium]|nr:hypothetical protein [Candidatus Gracilibacteria bacterium]
DQNTVLNYIENGDSLVKRFCKSIPYQLEAFFKHNPEDIDQFFSGFAYWIIRRVKQIKEKNDRYDHLIQRLKDFNSQLFKELKDAANGLAEKIIRFQKNHPKCMQFRKHVQNKRKKYYHK